MATKIFFINLHKLNSYLTKSIRDPEKIFLLLFTTTSFILSIFNLYQTNNNAGKIKPVDWPSILFITVATGLFIIVWFARKFFIRHTHPFAHYFLDFFEPVNRSFYFRKNTKNFISRHPDLDSDTQFRFAKEEDLELVTDFYMQSYLKTSWKEKKNVVCKRVKSHIAKNKHSILIFLDKVADNVSPQPVGYTHIVALNQSNWIEFRLGAVNDIRLTGDEIISASGSTIDNNPFGILIISSNICRKIVTSEKNYKEYIGKKVIQALALHLNEYCKNEFGKFEVIPVIFQTLRPDVRKTFKDFYTGVISKDYGRIYRFDLKKIDAPDRSFDDICQQEEEIKRVVKGFDYIIIITSAILCIIAYLVTRF